jgi:DNA repair ATPase RecN
MYVLYNNKYYLMHNTIGQWVPTSELNESFQFNDKTKAENALANLPKQMRNLGYFVQQIDAPSKPVEIDRFDNSELANYDSALAQIASFCDLHDQLVARATWIEYKLKEVENKIQDVLHAIEFNSYNARDGYKIYKLLHDLRLERRKYKDEQIIADVMKSGFAGSNWELVRSRIDDLKDRQYHVREMEELFE